MNWLIGIKKNVNIEIREKLSLTTKKQIVALSNMKRLFEEVVIISTCNRTEIYFNGSFKEEEQLKEVFRILGWDFNLREYIFITKDKEVCRHLFEVICGFHSKILGEDQILGQIRDSYELSLNEGVLDSNLLRLFQEAISCGKKFRTESKLFEIPVSSASIAVNKVIEQGAKTLMVIGYGNVGQLVVKYALGTKLDKIFIVVRDKNKVVDLMDNRIEVIDFEKMKLIINEVDSVISCTSAPHLMVYKKDVREEGHKLIVVDLALPRDIDMELNEYKRVSLFDIDVISRLDNENKQLRTTRMYEYKFLIDRYIEEYDHWINIREVSQYIRLMKQKEKEVVEDRITSFRHKCKSVEDKELAEVLINSTSNFYVNRAIKLLKEEKLKGREEECISILEKIFL